LPDEDILLDVMGLRCPIPVQRVRSALRSTQPGQTILVIGDDPESLHDIPKLLERLELEPPIITETDSGWSYLISN
jgi:tRNA 2-thiouridine synthesizing protein A